MARNTLKGFQGFQVDRDDADRYFVCSLVYMKQRKIYTLNYCLLLQHTSLEVGILCKTMIATRNYDTI